MKRIFIGTSGYNYRDWIGIFYPEMLAQRNWLSYYAEQFRTVEINATFYGSFKEATFQKWAMQVPSDFCFTIKGPRFITHIKRLKDVEESIERFFTSAEGLEGKLSCVLWQFPGNFHCSSEGTMERLERFLSILPQSVRHALEFRHETWFSDDVYELFREYNVGFVINDSSRYPWREEVTADFVYIRFHGPQELYASEYSEEEMKRWAKKIATYRESRDVYCYFNNDFHGYGITNAKQLINFLTS